MRAVTDARGAFALEVDGPGPFRLELHARPAHGDVRPLTPLVPFDPAPGGARALLLRVRVDPPDAGAGVPAR
ncbi:MAG: hypothetical protein H6828_15710 [Planctomycetes bacterium]|nr:hypothetical protein [Planctomycetota bacterium]